MAYLVDDDGDQGILGCFAVGAIFFWARAVEADHRIFHPIDGPVYTDCDGVRVVKGIAAVDFKSMGDCFG